MNKEGYIDFAGKQIHIRDLFMDIFFLGAEMNSNDLNETTMQVIFAYWLKEKLGEL